MRGRRAKRVRVAATLRDLYEAVIEGARRAGAAEDDDGDRDHGRPAADSLGQRHRGERDEADRRADGRRHDQHDVLTLVVIPAVYSLWKEREVPRHEAVRGVEQVMPAAYAQ